MINAEPRPGEDELINYRVQKRKRTYAGNEEVEPETEALTIQQRMKKKRDVIRNKAKIKRGRERAKRRMANKDVLTRRSQKAARKEQLPFARRAELEKRLNKPSVKKRIKMLAKRMYKDVRKKEMDRKKR